MKHLLLFLLSFFYVSNIWSAPRSELQARKMAEHFMQGHRIAILRSPQTLSLIATSHDLEGAKKRAVNETQASWYAYNYGEKAFVIISGDDRMVDVLGYSFDNKFCVEEMPDNLKMWLKAYSLLAGSMDSTAEASRLSYSSTNTPSEVLPLLGSISYNQGDPYNRQCPTVDGKFCVTGCVATAMATIMRYYQYPAQGEGYKTYTSSQIGQECSFNYDVTPFDWDNILPAYDNEAYNEKQADAVATLMKACGVASKMDYSLNNSWAYYSEALLGLIENLKYNPYMIHATRANYPSSEWMQMIKESLANGYPVYYCGDDINIGGHAFVLDGYDSQGFVHVNWGWGGYNNGYYEILSLNPNLQGNGNNASNGFSFSQSMLYGFKPATDKTCSRQPQFFSDDMYIEDDRIIITNLYNHGYVYDGSIAIVAENNGSISLLSEEVEINSLPSYYGYKELDISLLMPIQLATGQYKVYAATKAQNDTQWMKVNGLQCNNPYYTLNVNNDGSYYWISNNSIAERPVAYVNIKSPTYNSLPFQFEIKVCNPSIGHEFFAPIYLSIVDDELSQISQNIYCGHVLLRAGQDTTLVGQATLQVEKNGNYQFYPTWFNEAAYEILGEPLTSEIRTGSVTHVFELSACGLDKVSYGEGETITCTFTASLAKGEEADLLSNVLEIYILNEEGQTVHYQTVDLFAEKDKPNPYAIKIKADYPEGEYRILYYNNAVLWSGNFSITKPTDVELIKTVSSDIPVYYPTPGEPTICFNYGGHVVRTDIYTLSGIRIYTTDSPVKTQNGYLITVSGLNKGSYLVNILTDDNRTYTLRICK